MGSARTKLVIKFWGLVLCVAAGCGSPRGIGEACATDAECQPSLICRGDKCDNATNQKCLSQSCDSQKDCQYVTGSLSTCGDNVTCDSYAHFCRNASNLNDGQVCTDHSQCNSGLCDNQNSNGISGWCTRSCTSDALCTTGNNTCAKDRKGQWRCLRVCLKADDCDVYNPTSSGLAKCTRVTSRDGSSEMVCQ